MTTLPDSQACPEPGIYRGVEFSDYLGWDALSASRMALLAKSPRHYRYARAVEPTTPMRLGSLYHCGVLEPIQFANRYAVIPDFHLHAENVTASGAPSTSTSTKYVRERVREYRAMVEGREIVDRAWYEQAVAIVREIAENPQATQLLNDSGDTELSIVWDDDGVRCKARIDKVAQTLGAIVDLKTTADLGRFEASLARYGYHRQLAHYHAGWHALTGRDYRPWLVVVESSAPHMVQAAPLSLDALEAGQRDRTRLMKKLRSCIEGNNWPPADNPSAWRLPAWADADEPITITVNGKTMEV